MSTSRWEFVKLFALFRIFILCVTGSSPSSVWGYTYHQVGVDSNFLIDNGRVMFAQSDGSLTVLSLETGAVLLREKSRDYSGTLKRVDEGILVLNYGLITLLNPTNSSSVWETQSHYEPNIIDGMLVSYDGNGLVQCRDLKTGTVGWAINLPGALQVVAESGAVLVHRAATYEDTVVPKTVLLDLKSGKELFQKEPPVGIHWDRMFFDGTNIYVLIGSYKLKRSDFQLERMAIWNSRGEEIRNVPINAEQQKSLRFGGEVFDLDQKTFYRGRIYASRALIPDDRRGKWSVARTDDDRDSTTLGYDLGDGFALIERRQDSNSVRSEGRETGLEIELKTPEGLRRGVLPYLTGRGRMSALGRAKGRILLGTSLGHVECIDALTGESQWLYVFPTIRHTMSYSSHGMPPTMSRAAAVYRLENGTFPKSGFQSADGNATHPRIIVDPDPTDPFRRLPLYLSIAWVGSVVPILLMLALHIKGRAREWNPVVLGGLTALLTVLVLVCFFELGSVSLGSSIALRLAILTGLIIGPLQAVRCHRRDRRVWAAVFAGLSLGIAGVIFPAFLAL